MVRPDCRGARAADAVHRFRRASHRRDSRLDRRYQARHAPGPLTPRGVDDDLDDRPQQIDLPACRASRSAACASRRNAIGTTSEPWPCFTRHSMPASRCSTRPTRTVWDDGDAGHNERLIARALATWDGDRSRIRVATKGGLTRPEGGWVPDGRATHLAAALRSQPPRARRRSDPPLSAARARSAYAARDERARARRLEARRPHRGDRAVQRHRRADRGSAAHHRDRLGAGGAERLAGRQHPQRRGRLLHSRTTFRCLRYRPLGGPTAPQADRRRPGARRGRGAARRRRRSRSRWPG